MTLTLRRLDATDTRTIGELVDPGGPLGPAVEWVTLEPAMPIPAGRYRVLLTTSARVQAGRLWSPAPDFVLPLLVDVPGHTGIRVHSLNTAAETEGCIGVGRRRAGPDTIVESRAALADLMARLEAAEAAGEETWLELTDPAPAPEPA